MKSKNLKFFGSENPTGFLKKKILLIGIIFTMLILPVIVNAATYHVDASGGDDTNNGLSPETAWKTLGYLNQNSWRFQTSDDILLKRGETFTDNRVGIKVGGTSSDPAIIGAYSEGPRPIIEYQYGGIVGITPHISHIIIQDLDIRNADGGQSLVFNADNISNVIIRRVNIDGNTDRNGMLLYKIDTYLIENCTVSNIGNSGIAIIGSVDYPITNGVIRNNIVHDIVSNDCITLHKDGEGNDIGPNHTVINNVLYNAHREEGLDLTSGDQIVVRDCETYNNVNGGISIGHDITNLWIDRHYSHDEIGVGIIVGPSSNVKITNSIIYNPHYAFVIRNTNNFEAYHNTIVYGDNSVYGIDIAYPETDGVTFHNNIITSTTNQPSRLVRYMQSATPENTNTDFSNNIWWRVGGSQDGGWYVEGEGVFDFDGWQARFPTDQFIDPLLVDPDNSDLTLQKSSPAIDAGVDVIFAGLIYDFAGNPRVQGSAPDIGAFESDFGIGEEPCDVEGDVSGDCKVDFVDLIMVAIDFGKTSGYNSKSDTDVNEIIDIFDIVFVARRIT